MAECAACGTYYVQLRVTRQALRSAAPSRAPNPRRADVLARFRQVFGKRSS